MSWIRMKSQVASSVIFSEHEPQLSEYELAEIDHVAAALAA